MRIPALVSSFLTEGSFADDEDPGLVSEANETFFLEEEEEAAPSISMPSSSSSSTSGMGRKLGNCRGNWKK